MHEQIGKRVQRALGGCVFPGCVIGLVRDSKCSVLPFGTLNYEAAPATEETVYDIASITKSIPTASIALSLIAEGKMALNDRVVEYIPELQNHYDATIEDLLRYRVQGVQMSNLKLLTFEQIQAAVLERGFSGPPGINVYTNLPAYLLGIVLERVTDFSIAALGRRFFEPLKMDDTTFFPRDVARVAPTEIDQRGEVRALPHDESSYAFAKAGRTVGHAGLFSTAPDLLNFLEALIEGKFPAVSDGAQKGLGWQLCDRNFMGQHAGAQTFGKTGFTGTSVLCDIDRKIALVILSNRTYPKRPPNDQAIFEFRRDIADIVLVA